MARKQKITAGAKIVPHLWFVDQAVEAASFYYGVSWQIVPTVLDEMMKDPDRSRAGRVMEAMLQMQKLDIARLAAAHAGERPTP